MRSQTRATTPLSSLNTSIPRSVSDILVVLKRWHVENGTDIDNWTMPELMEVVQEFQIAYGGAAAVATQPDYYQANAYNASSYNEAAANEGYAAIDKLDLNAQ